MLYPKPCYNEPCYKEVEVYVSSLYFQLTPAVSREGNKDCILMGFYDAHDVWHFLSAISLFFSFLVSV